MKPLKLIPALLLLIIGSSCEKLDSNKTKTTTVTGQVRTYGTEDPVRGAPVSVMLWHEFDASNLGFDRLDSVRTDENGFYTITADLKEGQRYFLSVDDYPYKLYIQSSWLSPSFSRRAQVPVGGSHTINLEPVAYGYIKFHFKSLNPQPDDIYGYNLGGGASEIFYGDVNAYRTWDFGANLSHSLALNKRIDGVWTNWKIQVQAPHFDTIPMLIEF